MTVWMVSLSGDNHLHPLSLLLLTALLIRQRSLREVEAIPLLVPLCLIAIRCLQRGVNFHLRPSLRSSRGQGVLDQMRVTASEREPNLFAAVRLSRLEGEPLCLRLDLHLFPSAHSLLLNPPTPTHRNRDNLSTSMHPPRARHQPRAW